MTAQPAPTPAIRCTDVRLQRGDTVVLDGLDLHVQTGRVHALLGRNGAGKSTTFRLLLGLMQPDSGSIDVIGQPPVY